MPPHKILAREFIFEIETAVADTWVEIGGINSFSPDRSKDDADTTDFNSGGWAQHLPAQRGLSVTLDGFFLEDDAGVRDAGQARVEEVAQIVGHTGLVGFRITSPATAGNNQISGEASFNYGGPGGGNNDAASWSAEAVFNGEPTIGTAA